METSPGKSNFWMETLLGQKMPAAGIQDQQIVPDVVISTKISTKKLKMELDIQVQVQGVIPEVEKKSGTSGEEDDRYSEGRKQEAEAPLEEEKYVSIEEPNNVPDEIPDEQDNDYITNDIPFVLNEPDDDPHVPAKAPDQQLLQ